MENCQRLCAGTVTEPDSVTSSLPTSALYRAPPGLPYLTLTSPSSASPPSPAPTSSLQVLSAVRGPIIVMSGVFFFLEKVSGLELMGYSIALVGFVW